MIVAEMTETTQPENPAPERRSAARSIGADGHVVARRGGQVTSKRHSGQVDRLKILLPVVACVIIGLVLAWPQLMPNEKSFRLSAVKIQPQEAETLSMTSARFVGTDAERRPYVVTATNATEASIDADHVDLTEPKADMTQTDGTWVLGSGATGVYHRDSRALDLKGDVTVFHDSGAEFHTERARVDLNTHDVSGDDPVTGQSPQATITSQGFRIHDRGKVVVFTGKAHLVLRQSTVGKS